MIRIVRMDPQPWQIGGNGAWLWCRPTCARGHDWCAGWWDAADARDIVRFDAPPGPGPCVRVVHRCGVWWWVYRVVKLSADGRGER